MATMNDPRWRAYLGLASVAAGLVALAASGDLVEHSTRFTVFYGFSGLGFALVASAATRLPLRGVIIAAVILRVIFLPVTPSISDDYVRYLWDGKVQLSGVNPYLHTPRAPALDGVEHDGRDLINHPGVRTPYPPLAEATFLGVAALDGGLMGLKLLFGLFDLATAAAIWWLAGARRRHAATVLYLLCPVVILQTWGQAHLEAVTVFLVVAAAALLVRRRDLAAGAVLGLAVAFRITPAVLLVPALLGGRAKPLRFLAGFVPTLAIPYVPYLLTGGAFGSLFESGSTWTGGALIYSLLTHVASRDVALLLCGAVTVGGAVAFALLLRGRERTATAFAWSLTLLVLCLPVVHAWYWLPPLALGLAAGVWLPVVLGMLAPLATPLAALLTPEWSRRLPPWPQVSAALPLLTRGGARTSRRRP